METLLLFLILALLLIPGLIYVQWQGIQQYKQSDEMKYFTSVALFIFSIVIEMVIIYGIILQLKSNSPLAE